MAVVDATGKGAGYEYRLTRTNRATTGKVRCTLGRLVATHGVDLIAIGNGTASRETDKLAADLIKRIHAMAPEAKIEKIVVVSERPASVFGQRIRQQGTAELDVSLRGAVSIARRLQDPLAELVKIEPKSIGVGQYQRRQPERAGEEPGRRRRGPRQLGGRGSNTASAPLLSRCRACRARWPRHRALA